MISIIAIFIIELIDAITAVFHSSMMTLPHHSSIIRELSTIVIIKSLQTAVQLATIVATILLDAIAPAPFVKAGWVDHIFYFFSTRRRTIFYRLFFILSTPCSPFYRADYVTISLNHFLASRHRFWIHLWTERDAFPTARWNFEILRSRAHPCQLPSADRPIIRRVIQSATKEEVSGVWLALWGVSTTSHFFEFVCF